MLGFDLILNIMKYQDIQINLSFLLQVFIYIIETYEFSTKNHHNELILNKKYIQKYMYKQYLLNMYISD